MGRLIDADATFELLRSLGSRDYRREKGTIMDAMKMISHPEYTPTVDAVEVKHGRWLFDSNTERYFCSACNEQALSTSRDEPVYDYDWEENLRYSHTETYIEEHLTSYCPNCGADMRERNTNDG